MSMIRKQAIPSSPATLIHLSSNDVYQTVMEKYKGAIPEFVNPKYTDDTKTQFKKPTRLECMMQEYPKLVVAMRPVKNNLKDAKVKFEKVGAADCGSSGEMAM